MEQLASHVNDSSSPHIINEVLAGYGANNDHHAPGNLAGKLTFLFEQERYKATHDELTGVANKRGLEEFLTKNKPPKGLMVIDGNNVKQVNDSLGHSRGDEIIKSIAGVVKSSVRADDFVARTGGDEFVVLLNSNPSKRSGQSLSLDEIIAITKKRIAKETTNLLSSPDNQDIVNSNINFDIAVGSAIWLGETDINQMIKKADKDMYNNKKCIKSGVRSD